jgi:hypothetical protein
MFQRLYDLSSYRTRLSLRRPPNGLRCRLQRCIQMHLPGLGF